MTGHRFQVDPKNSQERGDRGSVAEILQFLNHLALQNRVPEEKESPCPRRLQLAVTVIFHGKAAVFCLIRG
jgi:hypothetical protein